MRSLLALLLLVPTPLLAADAGTAQPLRLSGEAFGFPSQIEVRDLPRDRADAAIRAAFAELDHAEAEARALERTAAGGQAVRLDAAASELLRRAEAFCLWSENAVSPLGGELFSLWGLRQPVTSLPTPDELDAATSSARCDRMSLDLSAATVRVAAGSRLELFPFDLGWGVDRAADLLKARGSGNFWIEVGPILRAAGGGPAGRGWQVAPQIAGESGEATSSFLLRDHSAAILTPQDHPLRVAGETFAPYLDQRNGRPGPRIVTLLVVTELAIDAEGVGYSMYALGAADGMLLVGSLQPRPAIRWYLGSGEGRAVISDINWASVPKR